MYCIIQCYEKHNSQIDFGAVASDFLDKRIFIFA